MNINEIYTYLAQGGGAALLISVIIQISPIELNPWTYIARKIGRALNHDITEQVNNLDRSLKELRADYEMHEAVQTRSRILRFGDEVFHGDRHSKEHFEQVMADIKGYETYCREHPDFKNHVADANISRIQDVYQKALRENDFL